MMHGPEKSDSAVRAMKPANKAGQAAAEWAEQRAGPEGNTGQTHTRRTQRRGSVSQRMDRVRPEAWRDATHLRQYPREEPYARIGHVRICAGGAQQWASLRRSSARTEADVDQREPLAGKGLSASRLGRARQTDCRLIGSAALSVSSRRNLPLRLGALALWADNEPVLSRPRRPTHRAHARERGAAAGYP
jgi:hypothetical protein